jgi:LPXTG-motif cell wall-anchored protein
MTAVRVLIIAALAALVGLALGTPAQAAAGGFHERLGGSAPTGYLAAAGGLAAAAGRQGDDGTGGAAQESTATPTPATPTPTAETTRSPAQPEGTPTPTPSVTSTPTAPAGEPTPDQSGDKGRGGLPVTGAQVGGMAVLGAGLLAAGIALLAVRRRRDLSDLLGS